MPGFGAWIAAALVVVVGVAVLEQFDERIAYLAAIMILLAVFLRYPAASSEIARLIRGG